MYLCKYLVPLYMRVFVIRCRHNVHGAENLIMMTTLSPMSAGHSNALEHGTIDAITS